MCPRVCVLPCVSCGSLCVPWCVYPNTCVLACVFVCVLAYILVCVSVCVSVSSGKGMGELYQCLDHKCNNSTTVITSVGSEYTNVKERTSWTKEP